MLKTILLLLFNTSIAHCFCQSALPVDSNNSVKEKLLQSNKIVTPINKPEVIIYPNPAKNKITLQVKQFDPGMAKVQVLDIRGKLVKEDSRLLTNGTEDIVMFLMLKAGIYFIQVAEGTKVVRKKIVLL
jgi:hypothetical protein